MTRHVLVVEDSVTQREQLRADLEAGGFLVTVARDGTEGYARFVAERPDAVLTDIVMPEMDGYELCKAVKRHPTRGATPVVLLTTLTEPSELVRALDAGADNFLRKPCGSTYLRARLGDILDQAGAQPDDCPRLEAEVGRAGERVVISFAKHQLLDLMYSSFEELAAANASLRAREESLRAAEAELRTQLAVAEAERRRLAGVLDAVPEALLIVEPDGTVGRATDELATLLGLAVDDIVGRAVTEILPLHEIHADGPEAVPASAHLVTQVLGGRPIAESGRSYGTWIRCAEGLRPVAIRVAQVPGADGAPAAAVAVVSDLAGLALRDAVTGLPGPDLFAEHVAVAQARPESAQHAAVLLVALDRFEALSEVLSEDTAAFLAATAERLEAAAAAAGDSLIAYLGRGEFGVLLNTTSVSSTAEAVAARLTEELRRPVSVAGGLVASTVSVGVALARGTRPDDAAGTADSQLQLLRCAATALRRARLRGGGCVEMLDEALRAAGLARLRLEGALRSAVAGGGIDVLYRPCLRLVTGETVAVEAAACWTDPSDTRRDPVALSALAEELGLASEVGVATLAEACRATAVWRRSLPGADGLQLLHHVPPGWLRSPTFADQVEAALTDARLPADALILGLAGGLEPDDEEVTRAAAQQLHRLGVEVAVTDFGRRSSLQSPARLGATLLVLEPELVAGIERDVADAALVAGLVRLAHGLGLRTLAAGVVEDGQALALRLMGCDLTVEDHRSAAHPAKEFEQWWHAQPTLRRGDAACAASQWATGESGEEASEAIRDDVLTYLAHELRNPLSTLSTALQLLDESRDGIDAALHDLLKLARQGAHRLSRIIDTLADIRTAQLGRLRVHRQPHDLAAELRQAVADIPELRQRVVARIPPSCPAEIDRHRIRQIVDNLLSNAVKYTDPDTPIEVELGAGRDGARLSVRDHGPGVPQDREHELFRKFARLGNQQPGTGLGLFLARAIARAHGGDLIHERPEGTGARFVLTLPTAAHSPRPVGGLPCGRPE